MPRVQMVDIPAGPPKFKLGVQVQRRVPRKAEDEPMREQRSNHASPALNSLARLSAQIKNLPASFTEACPHKHSSSVPPSPFSVG